MTSDNGGSLGSLFVSSMYKGMGRVESCDHGTVGIACFNKPWKIPIRGTQCSDDMIGVRTSRDTARVVKLSSLSTALVLTFILYAQVEKST